jgi:hypothetical protein
VSNYIAPAYHPKEQTIRAAEQLDNYFGPHEYGVKFPGDAHIYTADETRIPRDVVFVPKRNQ